MNLVDVIDALENEDAGMGGNDTSTYGQAALLLRSAAVALEFYANRERYLEACIPLQDDMGARARAWFEMGQAKPGGPYSAWIANTAPGKAQG